MAHNVLEYHQKQLLRDTRETVAANSDHLEYVTCHKQHRPPVNEFVVLFVRPNCEELDLLTTPFINYENSQINTIINIKEIFFEKC